MNILKIGLFMLFLGLFEAAVPDIEDRFNNLEDQVKKLDDQIRGLSKTVEDVVRILQQNNNQKVEENTGKTQQQPSVKATNEENKRKGDQSMSNIPMNKKPNNYAIHQENDVKNDTDLEQRVQILEFQMNTVIDDVTTLSGDVTTLTDDVTDLEEDVETQITLIQADLTFIQADQTTQDQRILELETDTESIAGAIFDLNNNISTLKTVDTAILGEIENLELFDIELDSRLDSLEVNGTVAFTVDIGMYTSIPLDSVVVFQQVRLNIGNGYDPLTGEFRVPSGASGLYYFQANFMINNAEDARFQIRLNGGNLGRTMGNVVHEAGFSTHSVGVTTQIQEGDIVDVFYYQGTDDTPVNSDNLRQSGFTGFRIAPQ